MANLFYRLTNLLFGWHWVWYESLISGTVTRRVRSRVSDGRPYIVWLGSIIFLDREGARITPITFTEDQMPKKHAHG